MDTAQWPQEIVVKPLEEIVTNTRKQGPGLDQGRKAGRAAQKDEVLNCPRCNSTNTKFCYYNNYSLTQPRYYCKTCRRYWTEGGSLRNIPVGGGSRKNKRSSTASATAHSNIPSSSPPTTTINNVIAMSNISSKLPDLVAPPTTSTKIHEVRDLNLGFARDFRVISDLVQVPNAMDPPNNKTHISSSALELLTGITNIPRGTFTSFMPASGQDPNSMSVYTNGFEFKPSLGFSLDGIGGGGYQEGSPGGGRLLFPFEDLKQVPSTPNNVNNSIINGSDHHHQQQQNVDRDQQADISTGGGGGYWTGMLGGGSW